MNLAEKLCATAARRMFDHLVQRDGWHIVQAAEARFCVKSPGFGPCLAVQLVDLAKDLWCVWFSFPCPLEVASAIGKILTYAHVRIYSGLLLFRIFLGLSLGSPGSSLSSPSNFLFERLTRARRLPLCPPLERGLNSPSLEFRYNGQGIGRRGGNHNLHISMMAHWHSASKSKVKVRSGPWWSEKAWKGQKYVQQKGLALFPTRMLVWTARGLKKELFTRLYKIANAILWISPIWRRWDNSHPNNSALAHSKNHCSQSKIEIKDSSLTTHARDLELHRHLVGSCWQTSGGNRGKYRTQLPQTNANR